MQNKQFFANSAKIFFTAPRGSRKGPDAPGWFSSFAQADHDQHHNGNHIGQHLDQIGHVAGNGNAKQAGRN